MQKRSIQTGKIVIFIGLCLFGAGAALQAEEPTVKMEDMVVTATKALEPRGNVTQKIDVIYADEINSMVLNHNNLAEILQYQPGIYVSTLSRNDANWGSFGGAGPKYNTFMLEGLPIDAFVDTQAIDPWVIERMEVQRGPASVLYPNYLSQDFAGNQSPLAGTTNLILHDRFETPVSRIAAYYGTFNTHGARVFHGHQWKDMDVFFGGFHESSDYTNYGTNTSWLNMIDNPGYQKSDVYLHGAYRINGQEDHKMTMFANSTWQKGDAGRPNRDFDHQYSLIQGGYQIPLSEQVKGNLAVGYRNYDRSWGEDNYPANLALKSHDGVKQEILPADLNFSFAHMEKSRFTLGTDYQRATYSTYSSPAQTGVQVPGNDADAYQYGVYGQEELVWKDFTFRLGGRFTHVANDINLLGGSAPGEDHADWDQFLWSTGVRYRLTPELALFTNVGTSFLPPSLKSIGGTLKLSDKGVSGKNGQLPNPDLQSENGIGYDLGMDLKLPYQTKFGIRGFLNVIDNQIVENVVVNTSTTSQSQSVNAGQTTAAGFEVEIRQQPLKWLGWFVNYTYTSTNINNDNDPDQNGADVPFVPMHMGNIGLTSSLPYDISASVWLQLTSGIYDSTSRSGRVQLDGHQVLNAHVEKILYQRETQTISAYLDLYNLSNDRYEMPWGFQDTGFSATTGIRAEF